MGSIDRQFICLLIGMTELYRYIILTSHNSSYRKCSSDRELHESIFSTDDLLGSRVHWLTVGEIVLMKNLAESVFWFPPPIPFPFNYTTLTLI